jgi:hypothetical protein
MSQYVFAPGCALYIYDRSLAHKMPGYDIIVYCVSCSKSMFVGGKTPRYLVDLLFGRSTSAKVYEPDAWHRLVDEFIASHTNHA